MSAPKRILIIAGPNGAGKTTYARACLPNSEYRHFVNADLIASGLSPFDPDAVAIQAGRLMIQRLEELSEEGESFAFETTLSGLAYVEKIQAWKVLGYRIKIVFLMLESAELSIERVAQRVRLGGHNIPAEVVRRRFAAGLKNFREVYQQLSDSWALVENSGEEAVTIDWSEADEEAD